MKLYLNKKKRKEKTEKVGQWWCTPLIPALRRQMQADLCEFEASLASTTSSRTVSKATEKPKPLKKPLKNH